MSSGISLPDVGDLLLLMMEDGDTTLFKEGHIAFETLEQITHAAI